VVFASPRRLPLISWEHGLAWRPGRALPDRAEGAFHRVAGQGGGPGADSNGQARDPNKHGGTILAPPASWKADQEVCVPEGKRVLRDAFKRLEQEVPERVARIIRNLRHPDARWVRIPVGLLCIVGGFSGSCLCLAFGSCRSAFCCSPMTCPSCVSRWGISQSGARRNGSRSGYGWPESGALVGHLA
jgi:hypothetical protein